MSRATRMGRRWLLAGGLGMGAVLAATPEIASADPSIEPLSWIDELVSGLSIPAQTTSTLDYQISISGMELFPTEGNTATATSDFGDVAIAMGNGAESHATGGLLDFAFANGTDSFANTGLGANLDFAFAQGTDSYADVGLGATFDNATAIGVGSRAVVGIGGSFDSAFADGNGAAANAGVGNHDIASAIGAGSNSSTAGVGNHDFASALGGGVATAGGFGTTAVANGADSSALTNGFFDTAGAYGGNADAEASGIGNFAWIVNTGSAFDQALAGGGAPLSSNFDVAEIFGTGSSAMAGAPGSYDLAAVFGDLLHALASGNNFLVDILPSL
jgi:hypothetical protein